MVEMELQILTACYKNMRDEYGVAVRTSIGEPKFPYDASKRAVCKDLMPWGLLQEADPTTFGVRYMERLEQKGVDRFLTRFTAIAHEHDDPRLVILCFEDVAKPEQWCHRTYFAKWWEEKTGAEVPEIQPQGQLL